MKKTKGKIAAVFAALLVSACGAGAAGDNGALYRNPNVGYFDFYYIPSMVAPRANINNSVMKIQARFSWYGSYDQVITTPQHALVAQTQQADPDNLRNISNQNLFTHGAGALVSENGLAMELWFRQDWNQTGSIHDDVTNAEVWDQTNNRCLRDVLGTYPTGTRCLSSTKGNWDYLTTAPNFQLKKGVNYWVRSSISAGRTYGTSTLYADLIEETSGGLVVVQEGSVDFNTSKFFPFLNQDVQRTVARTPGSPNEPYVYWHAFDDF